jgi:hypothetical protein
MLGTTAALALALSGCLPASGDSSQDATNSPAAQEQSATARSADSDTGRGSTERSMPTATTQAAKPVAAGGDSTLTAPGTKLALGEAATTHSNTGEKGSDKYKEATFVTKVTKITAGSEADLAELKDAAKFAGQTPYYVFYESTLTSLSAPSAGISDPRIDAQLQGGTDAQKLIVFGTLADCGSGSFETEGKDDAFTYKLGSTKSSCSVFLAPAGDAVTTASYSDTGFSYENYSDNKYRENPIVWGK